MATKKKHRKKIKKAASHFIDPNQKLLLPTKIHAIDGTLMVLVNPIDKKNHRANSMKQNSTHIKKSLEVKGSSNCTD